MITPNSRIILLKTPIELDENNQLTFSNKTAQYNYFYSLPKKELDEATFQRKDGTIRFETNEIDFTFDDVMEYNYCMYQNTTYGNRWFYAFITKHIYINDGLTDIELKTDVFQTYYFDASWKRSFVEREHLAKTDDVIGANTQPENLETGEFICNSHYKDSTMDSYSQDLCFIMASTSEPVAGEAKDTVAPSGIYNGIYTGLTYYRYDVTTAIDTMLEIFANSGKTSAINGVFMAPKWLAPLSQSVLRSVEQSNSPASFNISVSKQSTLNGYTPKNAKTLCFPYNYLLVSNNIGQNAILHYEKFSGSNATFVVKGVLNPGCSINLTPTNYNGNSSSDIDAIQLGKFPICNFQNDMYTNWLTQNSINILGSTITSDDLNIASEGVGATIGAITGAMSGNLAGTGLSIASGLTGIADAVMQKKQHNMIPPSIVGQLNSADVNVASGNNTFHFYKMSVKQQFARVIDDFFSMYGYKTNRVKIPNTNNRSNWNYVKTIQANLIGDIPQEDMQELKDIFNKGVTLWHNPNTFLDYSQNNN